MDALTPRRGTRRGLALAAALVVGHSPGIARAQTVASGQALEEIVVTARKREERLQQTPIAVTAFDAKALEAKSVATIRDIGASVPNMVATHGGAASTSDANFFIRGIGQEDFNATRDPGVGLYLDGVYLGRTAGAALESLDIERIEVLRGPQGTLFGRNTIGGAVAVTTKQPDGAEPAVLQTTIGQRDRFDVRALLPLALGAETAASVALVSRRQDGWVRRAFHDETLGDTDVLSGRLKIATQIGGFSVHGAADYTRSRGTAYPTLLATVRTTKQVPNLVFLSGPQNPPTLGSPAVITVPRTTPFGVPLPQGMNDDTCPSRDCTVGFQSGSVDNPSDIWGAAVTATGTLGALEVKSITAYRGLQFRYTPDFDGTSYVMFDQVNRLRQRQFSQEFSASGSLWNDTANYIVGAYYYDERVQQRPTTYFGSNQHERAPVAPADFRGVTSNLWIRPNNRSVALYAQGGLAVTERVSVTAGARATRERKTIDYDVFIDNTADGISLSINDGSRPDLNPPFIFFVPAGGRLASDIPSRSETWTPFTYRAGLEFQATPDLMVYGSLASGFRSGGFNGRPTTPEEATAFSPEKTRTVELGVKSEWLDRTVRLNVAGFYTDYSDIQVLVPAGVFFAYANTAATLKGVEAELVAQPLPGLRVEAGVGYLDARIDRTLSADIVAGRRLAGSPEWTIHVAPQYRLALGNRGSLTVRTDVSYLSRVQFYNSSSPEFGEQSGYTVVNARLGWASADERLSIAAYGLNVLNKRYVVQATADLESFGTNTVEPAPPSEFGLEASYRF